METVGKLIMSKLIQLIIIIDQQILILYKFMAMEPLMDVEISLFY
jgi:hypothetical protein